MKGRHALLAFGFLLLSLAVLVVLMDHTEALPGLEARLWAPEAMVGDCGDYPCVASGGDGEPPVWLSWFSHVGVFMSALGSTAWGGVKLWKAVRA